MLNHLIRDNIFLQVAHNLMDINNRSPDFIGLEPLWFDVRIN
jgi:hypothetical protein